MASVGLREEWARRYGPHLRHYTRGYQRTAPVAELERDLAVLGALARRDALLFRLLRWAGGIVMVVGLLASVPVGPQLGAAALALGVVLLVAAAWQPSIQVRRVALASAWLRSLAVPPGAEVRLTLVAGRTDLRRHAGPQRGHYALEWLKLEAPLEGDLRGTFTRTERVVEMWRRRRRTLTFTFAERLRLELAPAADPYRREAPPTVAADARMRLALPPQVEGEAIAVDARSIDLTVRSPHAWSVGPAEGLLDAAALSQQLMAIVAGAARLAAPVRTPSEQSTAWMLPLRRSWFVLAGLVMALGWTWGAVDAYGRWRVRGAAGPIDMAMNDPFDGLGVETGQLIVLGIMITGVIISLGTSLVLLAVPFVLRRVLPAPR